MSSEKVCAKALAHFDESDFGARTDRVPALINPLLNREMRPRECHGFRTVVRIQVSFERESEVGMVHMTERVGRWINYHKTIIREEVAVTRMVDDATPADVAALLSESATLIGKAIDRAVAAGDELMPVGSSWSFSDILRSTGGVLETAPAGRMGLLLEDQVTSAVDPERRQRLVLCHAGTSVHDLNAWLEPGLSLRTSGAHDGQRVGGVTGTGTHGSVVDYGAFQNQVRGLHFVTGDGDSIWVERGPQPLLTDEFVGRFATQRLCESDAFLAGCVHLGGLGVLNGVLLEVAQGYTVDVVRRRRILDADDLHSLASGDFTRFGDRTWPAGAGEKPYYVEIILDPFHPYEGTSDDPRPALITLLYQRGRVAGALRGQAEPAQEPLNLLAAGLERNGAVGDLLLPPWTVARVVASQFKDEPGEGEAPARRTWGQVNGPHKRARVGPVEIDLFNAAYALPREQLATALPVMLQAFARNGGGHLVFTLRFVEDAQGLLAFTRFPRTVVVNMDGLRTDHSREAAKRVALALETAGIPFSQHWGKQGVISPTRFVRDFGDPADPASAAGRWRRVRERLLDERTRRSLTNAALETWGLS